MSPQATDQFHFDVQLAYTRPVVALLALSCLLELRPVQEIKTPLAFLFAYLVIAVMVLGLERALKRYKWRLPLVCDVLVVGIFLYRSPVVLPVWFPLFFVAFAVGFRWNLKSSLFLCFGLLLLAVALRMHRATPAEGMYPLYYSLPFFSATLLGAGGMALLGDRNRQFAAQQSFLGRLSNTMHVDLGLAESLRLLLEELCAEFQVEEALLAYRDADLERIFLWQLKSGESERLSPENLPLTRSDGFL